MPARRAHQPRIRRASLTPGTFAEQTGQSSCAACDPGSFSNEFTPGSFASRASFVAGDSEIITSTDGMGSNAAVAPWYLAAWRPQSRHGAEVILFTEFGTTRLDLRQVDLATNEVTTLTSLALPGTSSDGNPAQILLDRNDSTLFVVDYEFRSISKLELDKDVLGPLVPWVGGYSNTGTDEDNGVGTAARFHVILGIDIVPTEERMIVLERDSQADTIDAGVKVKIRRSDLATHAVSTVGLIVTDAQQKTLVRVSASSPVGVLVGPDGAELFLTEGPANRVLAVDLTIHGETKAPPFPPFEGGPCKYQHSGPSASFGGTCDKVARVVVGNVTQVRSLARSPSAESMLILHGVLGAEKLSVMAFDTEEVQLWFAAADTTFANFFSTHAIYSRVAVAGVT